MQLPHEKNLFIAGGFENGRRAVMVRRGHCEEVDALESDHEETDTRVDKQFLKPNYKVESETSITMQLIA